MIEFNQLRGLPVIEVPEAGVIDLDATLVDPNAAMERFYIVGEEFYLDKEEIQKNYEASKKGGSFSPLDLLETHLNPKELRIFEEKFRTLEVIPFVYDDTLPFLYYADGLDYPIHGLTYGVSVPWQKDKIIGGKLPNAWTILEHTDKGSEIESWRNDATYDFVAIQEGIPVAIYIAHSMSEVDDKPEGYEERNKPFPRFLMQRPTYEKSANNRHKLLAHPGTSTDLIHGVNELAIENGVLIKGHRKNAAFDLQRTSGKTQKPYTKYIPLSKYQNGFV